MSRAITAVSLIIVFGLFMLAGPISCKVWEYKECKAVGHSAAYCTWKFTQPGK